MNVLVVVEARLHVVDDGHLFLVSRARDVAPVVRRFLSGGDAPAATSPSAAKATTAVQTGSAADADSPTQSRRRPCTA